MELAHTAAAPYLNAHQYRPHNPQNSNYYRCVEDHFETFELVYDERFSRRYGFFRSYVKEVIYRYLDCGDLHNGPVSGAPTAAMNTCFPFPASAAISARHATRSEWLSLENGCDQNLSRYIISGHHLLRSG